MSSEESCFEGVALALPAPIVNGSSALLLRLDDAADASTPGTQQGAATVPAPVRHAHGYAPFLSFVEALGTLGTLGTDAGILAADPPLLLAFLRRNISAITEDPTLWQAASIFLGNTIAALRPDAVWQTTSDSPPEVAAGRNRFVPLAILERLASAESTGPAAEALDTLLRELCELLQEWASDIDDDAMPPPRLTTPSLPDPAIPPFIRPELPTTVYRDAAGTPIDYGRRWGEAGPSETSYIVTSDAERFEVLHTVTRALIDYLALVYDVEVHRYRADSGLPSTPLLRRRDDVSEIVQLLPRSSDAAPLVFAFTEFPGLIVEAGVLHDFPFPSCGCDACDENGVEEVERLEETVFSVIGGGFAEHYPLGRRREANYALVTLDTEGQFAGASSGTGEPSTSDAARLALAEATLAALPNGWIPWPLR